MDVGHGFQELSTFWSIDDIADRLEWLEALGELRAQQTGPKPGPGPGFPFPGGPPFRR